MPVMIMMMLVMRLMELWSDDDIGTGDDHDDVCAGLDDVGDHVDDVPRGEERFQGH